MKLATKKTLKLQLTANPVSIPNKVFCDERQPHTERKAMEGKSGRNFIEQKRVIKCTLSLKNSTAETTNYIQKKDIPYVVFIGFVERKC